MPLFKSMHLCYGPFMSNKPVTPICTPLPFLPSVVTRLIFITMHPCHDPSSFIATVLYLIIGLLNPATPLSLFLFPFSCFFFAFFLFLFFFNFSSFHLFLFIFLFLFLFHFSFSCSRATTFFSSTATLRHLALALLNPATPLSSYLSPCRALF